MNGKMNISYDEEGDYLEIYIEGHRTTYGEDIGDDITVFKDEKTGDVVGIGILNFKKRARNLQEISPDLPFKVNFEAIKV